MQGFVAGIMIAASFWSLLQPSIEYGKDGSLPAWLPLCNWLFVWWYLHTCPRFSYSSFTSKNWR